MEDVLGGRTDPPRFAAFLADWEAILARRADEAITAFAGVEPVHGLVLAGSIGRDEPWPLSDIDLLLIYDNGRMEEAQAGIERLRLQILDRWIDEGWWTGLDIGRLVFSRREVVEALALEDPAVIALLADDRWYHSLDKGYRGRAGYDPTGLAAELARWLTDHRFSPPVVRLRLARARQEVHTAACRLQDRVASQDPFEATKAVREAVKWLQTWRLEAWGERDASLARVGTRFERLARAHGQPELIDTLRFLSDLDDASVERRMAAAPEWVRERHDRSWRARRHVGEQVTHLEDARDVLRVCSVYEMRRLTAPSYPAWLAIPAEVKSLYNWARSLSTLLETWFDDSSLRSLDPVIPNEREESHASSHESEISRSSE